MNLSFSTNEMWLNGLVSLGYFLALVLIRIILLRWVNRLTWSSAEVKRIWIVSIRNGFVLLFIFGLLVIWAHELRSVALSLAALAVAIVLAFKELFLCLSGGFLRASSRSFGLGDRIEIQGIRGDVIDENLFVTTLLEVGPGQLGQSYTGRAVTFPNSLLLSHLAINESYTDDFVLHPFIVPLNSKDDWKRAEKVLLSAAQAECASYLSEAQRHFAHISYTRGLETPVAEPRVTVHLPSPDRIDLLVRIPAPARKRGRVEQAILRRYLEEIPSA